MNIIKLIAKMRMLESDHEPDGWPAVQMQEISALCDTIEQMVPSIDRLQDRLEEGCHLEKDDGKWWLFDARGEGIVGGETLRELLINLIFRDC